MSAVWWSALALSAALLAAPVAAESLQPKALASRQNEAVTTATRLIAAVNGDAEARRTFASDFFASTALAAEPASARAAFLDQLAADSGGLVLQRVKPEGERMAEVTVATRKGTRFARIVLFTSRREPGRITNLFVLPARDPAKLAKEAWPTHPIRLEKLAAELGWRLDSLAADDAFSGVVLVGVGDRVLFRRAYGLAEQAWKQPNRVDTAFQAGSVTKMLTAAAILKLVEQGTISLDDSLAKWVPDYPHATAAGQIRIRHLLSHTAGLGPWEGRLVRAATTGELVRTMMEPPKSEPGAAFAYSNAGYVLLGAVLERATQEEFETALKRLVLDPVGMKRTAAWPVTAIVPNRATGYLRPESDPLAVRPRYANHQYLGYKGDGSGGVYTTADDLWAFHRALVGGRLLGPEATRLMLTAATDFPGAPRPSKYGLGVRLSECAGQPTFGHSGGGANSGVSNATFGALSGDWTVVVLSNYDPDGEQVAQDICDALARR